MWQEGCDATPRTVPTSLHPASLGVALARRPFWKGWHQVQKADPESGEHGGNHEHHWVPVPPLPWGIITSLASVSLFTRGGYAESSQGLVTGPWCPYSAPLPSSPPLPVCPKPSALLLTMQEAWESCLTRTPYHPHPVFQTFPNTFLESLTLAKF